jgi:Ca2+-binding RTX toxin-like protein
MTVFKAFQPTDLDPITIRIAMDVFFHGTVLYGATGKGFEVTDGYYEIDFHGASLKYANGFPTSGSIKSLQVSLMSSFSSEYKFSSMSLSVSTLDTKVFRAFYNTGNFMPVLNLFLNGHDILDGSNGHDVLPNFGGHDRMIAGPHDYLSGGQGYDTFVFHAGFGNVTIHHFVAGSAANHDIIELHSILGLANFSQVKGHESLVGGDLVITDAGGDSIRFDSLHSKAALTAADFHFLV